ncbi:uridylate-specific endoribonuclease-like [Oculina patagonica]
MADFKTTELKEAWFEPFPGKGFKHVFVGEKRVIKKKNVYSGFHNWYQFYLQQVLNEISDVQLDSFTNNTKPSFIRMNFKWDKATKKCPSSMYVGTSPAFDFALFSTCFITLYKGPSGGKLGNECTCKIDNSNLTIKAIEKPTGSGKICTAYPRKLFLLQVL